MWFLIGLVVGVGGALLTEYTLYHWLNRNQSQPMPLNVEIKRFFGINDVTQIEVKDRSFTVYANPDVKLGLERWLKLHNATVRVVGVPPTDSIFNDQTLGGLLSPHGEQSLSSTSIDYQSFDIGEGEDIECPRHALWFITVGTDKLVVLWTTSVTPGHGWSTKLRIGTGYIASSPAQTLGESLIQEIETTVQTGQTYRGKVLSLENDEGFSGRAGGLRVHQIRKVARADVVLPESTVTLLERNVIRFIDQRSQLSKLGMPVRKGLLFYGPPGTGKTHTIHYLLTAIRDHTTLLITAEQMGSLAEYISLARLLQPSIVIIEDVDLIATQRDESTVCQQSLLNRLLNEMDGLREDSAILFLLTTNRPEVLESALAARPGRVDQAVEIPLPDSAGREKLIGLYACGAHIEPEVVAETVRQTEGVSASFIKELMRRALQFHLECRSESERPEILRNDIDQAIEELLWSGGLLNRTLLGAGEYPCEE